VAVLPAYVLEARRLLNEGSYAQSLGALQADGWEVVGDPAREGARRLAGCLMIVLGRHAEGLALLDRSRLSSLTPAFPALEYSKRFDVPLDEPARLAVGLLECLALGLSVAELAGDGSAFQDTATLRSLRLIARALEGAGRVEDAGRFTSAARRWGRQR
jgi:hypothetical protein